MKIYEKIIIVILMVLLIAMIFKVGYNLGENKGKNKMFGICLEVVQNTEIPKVSTEWKNFVIVGENVKIYVDTDEIINFNGSTSYWLEVVHEKHEPIDEISFWNRTININYDGSSDYALVSNSEEVKK